MSLGSNGVDRVCSLWKFQCDFVARTFALIAPVQPVLHWALCSNKTIQNAPKHYEMQQYMSSRSNGVRRVHSLQKLQNDSMAQTCALIAPVQPVLQRVSCSNETLPNAPKYYETHENMSLGSNGVVRVRSLQKFRCDFVAKTFALIVPVQPILHKAYVVTKQSKMHPNTTKCTNTWV